MGCAKSRMKGRSINSLAESCLVGTRLEIYTKSHRIRLIGLFILRHKGRVNLAEGGSENQGRRPNRLPSSTGIKNMARGTALVSGIRNSQSAIVRGYYLLFSTWSAASAKNM